MNVGGAEKEDLFDMINISQMKNLVADTCSKLGDKYASEDAVNLVLATGIVESRYEYIKQMGNGPARSFWQVEPKTAIDNLQHYLKHRPSLMQKCAEATLVDIKHGKIMMKIFGKKY